MLVGWAFFFPSNHSGMRFGNSNVMPTANTREGTFSLIHQLFLFLARKPACYPEQSHALALETWPRSSHSPDVQLLPLGPNLTGDVRHPPLTYGPGSTGG